MVARSASVGSLGALVSLGRSQEAEGRLELNLLVAIEQALASQPFESGVDDGESQPQHVQTVQVGLGRGV